MPALPFRTLFAVVLSVGASVAVDALAPSQQPGQPFRDLFIPPPQQGFGPPPQQDRVPPLPPGLIPRPGQEPTFPGIVVMPPNAAKPTVVCGMLVIPAPSGSAAFRIPVLPGNIPAPSGNGVPGNGVLRIPPRSRPPVYTMRVLRPPICGAAPDPRVPDPGPQNPRP